MLNTRLTLSTGLKAVRSFSTTQVAQKPLSNKTIEKLNRLGLPIPPEQRAMTAYSAFVKAHWQANKDKHDVSDGISAIASICSEAWRELPAAEKKKYVDTATKLQEEAKKTYVAFYSQLKRGEFAKLNEALPPSSRLVRPRGLTPAEDRRPGGPYLVFCKENFKSDGLPMTQQASELGARWKKMTAEEKAPYVEASEKQRAAYKQRQEEKAATTVGSPP